MAKKKAAPKADTKGHRINVQIDNAFQAATGQFVPTIGSLIEVKNWIHPVTKFKVTAHKWVLDVATGELEIHVETTPHETPVPVAKRPKRRRAKITKLEI